ncbi:DHA1 family bicyclomycin/chloramphenicol resistance-like MFS transporter [Wenyingzhuangia heitensis]|uniref:DHA1 family bicyclomycin/chloramphenicol resistance-like MFS transporter n=1 Tax=Wenyingzhuangia heitensis TaxID=1487859 RepID=A0ABX0U828_9FLAO|nr:multidrug effflux MFS transporter [Wenyingzhuangia heitensis]NIJ45000.1 DHA1 family bicyclomycin/chloramphenicol resistance-like MFS transporter [Wenyingzhuangia heitensis]
MKSLKIHKNNYRTVAFLMALLIALSPFAIDSFLSAMPLMATFYGVTINVIELTITVYFLGFAIGNFFGGPLSDTYGRKPITLIGVGLYGLSALVIPFCTQIEWVLFFRFLQAFGGGFATVTSNLFIRDLYSGKQVAKLITMTAMIMMLAPLCAPILGTYITFYQGWQGVFYFLFLFALLLFVIFMIFVPESRESIHITKKITINQFFKKYRVFLSHKKSVLFLMAICLPVSGLYIFITSSSFIYLEYFGISTEKFPFFFGANILLNIILSLLNTYLLKFYSPVKILKTGLILQLTSGLLLMLTILFNQDTFWNVFVLIVFFIGSLGLIFGNGSAIILNINPEASGSANATLGITRFLLGFLLGTSIAVFHSDNLIPIGVAMFACSLAGNIFFYFYQKASN